MVKTLWNSNQTVCNFLLSVTAKNHSKLMVLQILTELSEKCILTSGTLYCKHFSTKIISQILESFILFSCLKEDLKN